MADENSADADLAVKKLELEIYRLELDLRQYDQRLNLSDKKLRADVRDWYYRLLVALVSTVVGVVTFLWTQSYQHYTDDYKATAAKIEADDKSFSDSIAKLNDPSTSVRLTAANGLITFADKEAIEPVAPNWLQRAWQGISGKGDSTVEFKLVAGAEKRRRRYAIQVAADRLNFEDDVRVLAALGRVLLAGGTLSVSSLSDNNQLLANGLTRDFGTMLAIGAAQKGRSDDCERWPELPEPLSQVDHLVARVQMPYQGTEAELRFLPSDFFLHSYVVKEYVTIECNLDYSAIRSTGKTAEPNFDWRASIVRQARALALTSFLLIEIVNKLDANSDDTIDLSRTQLVTGTKTREIRWRHVNLDSAYLRGTPSMFICEKCSLVNASLQDLHLNNGYSFPGSQLAGAHFAAGFRIDP